MREFFTFCSLQLAGIFFVSASSIAQDRPKAHTGALSSCVDVLAKVDGAAPSMAREKAKPAGSEEPSRGVSPEAQNALDRLLRIRDSLGGQPPTSAGRATPVDLNTVLKALPPNLNTEVNNAIDSASALRPVIVELTVREIGDWKAMESALNSIGASVEGEGFPMEILPVKGRRTVTLTSPEEAAKLRSVMREYPLAIEESKLQPAPSGAEAVLSESDRALLLGATEAKPVEAELEGRRIIVTSEEQAKELILFIYEALRTNSKTFTAPIKVIANSDPKASAGSKPPTKTSPSMTNVSQKTLDDLTRIREEETSLAELKFEKLKNSLKSDPELTRHLTETEFHTLTEKMLGLGVLRPVKDIVAEFLAEKAKPAGSQEPSRGVSPEAQNALDRLLRIRDSLGGQPPTSAGRATPVDLNTVLKALPPNSN